MMNVNVFKFWNTLKINKALRVSNKWNISSLGGARRATTFKSGTRLKRKERESRQVGAVFHTKAQQDVLSHLKQK